MPHLKWYISRVTENAGLESGRPGAGLENAGQNVFDF